MSISRSLKRHCGDTLKLEHIVTREYMLLLHESTTLNASLSPTEMQQIIARYQQWSAKVAQSGKLVAGHKLRDDIGRMLSKGPQGLVIRDGPFAEAKEVMGGYFLIRADSIDEAMQICSDCPHLDLGGRIELREIEVVK